MSSSMPRPDQISNSQSAWHIAAFYKFSRLDNREALQAHLKDMARVHKICGTILLAPEGLNGTIAGPGAGPGAGIELLLAHLRGLPGFADLKAKWSVRDTEPFFRFKARLKKQIITMGEFELDADQRQGQHLDAQSWNTLLEDPELVLIDTRNDYEVKVGTFEKAISPNTQNFGELPEWIAKNLDPAKHKKVAMFCTGGIRCEKASAYMLEQGFDQVFQLDGGILKYLETTPKKANKWEGECFVFDGRVSVDKHLNEGKTQICYGCREPLTAEDIAHSDYEAGITCRYCTGHTSDAQKQRFRERQKQQLLAQERQERHIGKVLDLKGKRPL